MNNLTLVTAYYDINLYEQRPKDRDKDFYMKHAEFLFKLPIHIVFFVSPEDHDYVLQKRINYGHLEKTLVIPKNIHDLVWSGKHPDIKALSDKNPVKNSARVKDGSYYYTLTWNKMYMVEEIMNRNPFGTTHFGWIDFGLYHVVKFNVPKIDESFLKPDTDKVKVLEIRWISKKEANDLKMYTQFYRTKIAGGLWVGGSMYLKIFFREFKKYLYTVLSNELIAHEELIMGLVYHHNYDIFKPFYGDFCHLLINYYKIVKPSKWMLINIDFCIKDNNHSHVNDICRHLYIDAYDKLTSEQKFKLFDKWSISSYYFDKNIAIWCVETWLEKLQTDKNQIKYIIDHKDRIFKNLSYYPKSSLYVDQLNNLLH
jgi:hypothetical protein